MDASCDYTSYIRIIICHQNYNQISFLDHPDSTLDDPRRCGEFREMEELLSYGLAGGI
jgi:hypothetical protein